MQLYLQSCCLTVLATCIMSYKPEPIPFQGYSGDEHIPVDQEDQEDAAALQLQNNAYPGLLDHRSNADTEGVAFGRSTTLTGERTTEPLPETTRSGIEGCTEVNKPLSCSVVDHDSESVVAEEPEGRALHNDTGHLVNPSVGNGVRRSSLATTRRSTAGHASQASDHSDQLLPISSSENAEEQGYAERDGTRKSKISSRGKPSKKRKK